MARAKAGSLGVRGAKAKMLARRGKKKKKVVAKKGRTAAEQRAAAARGLSKVRGGVGSKLIPEGGIPTKRAAAARAPKPAVRGAGGGTSKVLPMGQSDAPLRGARGGTNKVLPQRQGPKVLARTDKRRPRAGKVSTPATDRSTKLRGRGKSPRRKAVTTKRR